MALLGRSAADAAFDFALAGADGGVIDALACLQAPKRSHAVLLIVSSATVAIAIALPSLLAEELSLLTMAILTLAVLTLWLYLLWLATLQAEEFCRWRRPQPLATLQACTYICSPRCEV